MCNEPEPTADKIIHSWIKQTDLSVDTKTLANSN